MSDWKRNGMTAAIAAVLGKCRSKAHHLRRASDQRMAGREARAQSIEHKVDRGLTQKERTARARELVAGRKTKARATAALDRGESVRVRATSGEVGYARLRDPHGLKQIDIHTATGGAKRAATSGIVGGAAVRDWAKRAPIEPLAPGRGTPDRLARAKQLVAKRRENAKPPGQRFAEVTRPTRAMESPKAALRQQADAARAAKGAREERLKSIGKRMYVTSKTAQVDREKVGQAAHRLERQDPAAARRMWSESERKDRTVKRLRARMASVAEAYKPGSTDTPGAKLPRFGGAHSPAPVPSPSPPARVEPPRPSLREQADAHRKKKGEGWSRQGIVAARLYKRAKADDRASKRAQASGKYPKAVDRLKRAVARTERANAIMEKRNALITTNVIEVQPKAIREMGR